MRLKWRPKVIDLSYFSKTAKTFQTTFLLHYETWFWVLMESQQQINLNTMLEKGMQHVWKMMKNGAHMGAKVNQQLRNMGVFLLLGITILLAKFRATFVAQKMEIIKKSSF